eukprot:1150843-Pelagomonas_calceolata.AAC.4
MASQLSCLPESPQLICMKCVDEYSLPKVTATSCPGQDFFDGNPAANAYNNCFIVRYEVHPVRGRKKNTEVNDCVCSVNGAIVRVGSLWLGKLAQNTSAPTSKTSPSLRWRRGEGVIGTDN